MKALVIGGGIIGLCSAYYLQRSGWSVTVVDRTDLSDNCSYGNLGMIVPSHFVPLAAPGMVAQGIRWMLNRRSPFYVKPSLDAALISWGLKFIKSATKEKAEGAAPSLLQLNLLSKSLYEDLAAGPDFNFGLERKGILMYYKTEKVGEEEVHLADKARRMGLDVAALSKDEVQALEPEIELDVVGAVHYRCDAHLYPNQLIPQLIAHLKKQGADFVTHAEAKRFVVEKRELKKVVTTTGEHEADLVVLAAGSWLPRLAKLAGLRLPLMPGKGYSFTDKRPQTTLNIPAILCEARVAITPMNGGIRYGGTMEIAPVNKKINKLRVEGIVQSVSAYFSNIHLDMPDEKDIWFGFRPCTPDGLPYIGFSKSLNNTIVAGGHAMMGLSLGPATGKIVADLAAQKRPEVDLRLFHPDRFS
jgi:D-amino-acid dehydrogenase